jgi:hypothetical protein
MKEQNGEIASLAGTAKNRGKAAPWNSIGLGVLVVGLFIAARMLPVPIALTDNLSATPLGSMFSSAPA